MQDCVLFQRPPKLFLKGRHTYPNKKVCYHAGRDSSSSRWLRQTATRSEKTSDPGSYTTQLHAIRTISFPNKSHAKMAFFTWKTRIRLGFGIQVWGLNYFFFICIDRWISDLPRGQWRGKEGRISMLCVSMMSLMPPLGLLANLERCL